MARQDIFAVLSDDVLGERCSSSSTKGKVRCINMWVNTDVAGDGNIRFCFDKDKGNVNVFDWLPAHWKRERGK